MKASDLFLRCLEAEGVDMIFGVPGEENADIMISLLDSKLEFIICHHEQGASFMADVYGRLTGRPGVCLATLGPGATNMATGVANANMDRSPVVGIVGQASTKRLHKESHQNMDAVSMYHPITKWATTISDPENIPEIVHKAFKLAVAEKPGATLIELPENIAKKDLDAEPFGLDARVRRPVAEEKSIDQAIALLETAKRPIILAGNGCARTRAAKQLSRFVEKTGIHVSTTFMGKGVVSAKNPLCLFSAGLASRDHVTDAFRLADLVIAIGYDMVEWHPSLWNVGNQKKIIHIDFNPAEVDENYRADVEIVGDLASSLWAINERLTDRHYWDNEEFKQERVRILRDLHEHDCDESYPMKPQRILSDLRRVMGPEDIVISDVGAHKIWAARNYPTFHPNTCIISNGFCSMGIAVPGAIAAKKLFPEKRIVGLCGDGGFLMNVQELATAVQYKIPTVFLVWVDNGYGMIAWKQELYHGRVSHAMFKNPNFVRLAEAFGCRGIEVETAKDFRPAMEAAFATTDRPTVVTVAVDYSENLKLSKLKGDIHSR
ncbi:MAG: acetolactate synthase large subunit [Myxococcales bacterium]|nr:MAG: acetolactate synthase large subunit [Myxococcales bacterium]